jgi:hypothetical protein
LLFTLFASAASKKELFFIVTTYERSEHKEVFRFTSFASAKEQKEPDLSILQ